MGGVVSPNRASNNSGINLASMGESQIAYTGSVMANQNDEIDESQEEGVRDVAQSMEELQRAQADTLTDDEFEEMSHG